jgi:hypothetical protein
MLGEWFRISTTRIEPPIMDVALRAPVVNNILRSAAAFALHRRAAVRSCRQAPDVGERKHVRVPSHGMRRAAGAMGLRAPDPSSRMLVV